MSLKDRMSKAVKSEYAQILSETDKFRIRDWISTGNYALNTLISGDPHCGFPSGRILQLAGPESTGKTYITLEFVKNAQASGYFIVYYDTEFAQDKHSLEERGIDITQLLYVPIDTVEKLSHSILNVLDEVKDERVLIVIDSIGNLSTKKELEDMTNDNDKADMTRAKKLKALFRTATLKCGLKNVPLVGVNHVYATIGCATGDMKVKMSDQTIKDISSIIEGDMVETLFGPKEVIETYLYGNKEVFELEMEDGTNIKVTSNHKFLTEKLEWKTVSELNEGDSIVMYFSVLDPE